MKSFSLLSEIVPQSAISLWHPWIVLGEIAIIDGDPGTNKSSMILDLAARISVGAELPEAGKAVTGGVVLLVGEDSLAKTVIHRLKAARADLTKIAALANPVIIPDDLDKIEEAVRSVNAKLIVIDPLMPFLGPNANFDQAVRKAMTPLAEFASKMETAVVMVRHLNKSCGRHSLYRGSGSIGIAAAMRSAMLVANSPDDDDLRVLCHVKNNLGPLAPSLLFEPVSTEDGSVRIEWRGVCNFKAEHLLAKPGKHRDRLEDAKEFLLDILANGSVKQAAVKAQAAEAGLAYRTVERAKELLGVQSRREGWGPGSFCLWSLPKTAD